MARLISYAEAVNEALHQAMSQDSSVICYGLGVDDPKRIFGTTKGLLENFGHDRVFDMPTAENAMLGVGIGAAISGLKPVMVHQRMDFFLLAMDQLVNAAAKWYYMFGEQRSVPITVRLMIGRGWGQGPTHSQSLQAWLAHVPGIRVIMPVTPEDAKGMLLAAINDPNPVVMLEHRWLHHQKGEVSESGCKAPLDKARIVKAGSDITLISMSIQTIESKRAIEKLEANGISVEHIDLRSVQPIDWETILTSVRKTGRILAVDSGMEMCSVASQITATAAEQCFSQLKCAPVTLAMPFHPEPTSYGLTKGFHLGAKEIAQKAHQMVTADNPEQLYEELAVAGHHDVPGDWFTGPF